jgi:hypothetical protein
MGQVQVFEVTGEIAFVDVAALAQIKCALLCDHVNQRET